ncbi:hypothetical protein BpHYR1_037611 [Brachionus plicatilis]|uniref:Uncharacterized protein n=1 Tax=Brachionus plicatilis TaxID=10195 RepID=A0A3M7S0N7_BRAPC|nr:hypothetical protein BpHYR1_037611 [Brachionus plicatilis]
MVVNPSGFCNMNRSPILDSFPLFSPDLIVYFNTHNAIDLKFSKIYHLIFYILETRFKKSKIFLTILNFCLEKNKILLKYLNSNLTNCIRLDGL